MVWFLKLQGHAPPCRSQPMARSFVKVLIVASTSIGSVFWSFGALALDSPNLANAAPGHCRCLAVRRKLLILRQMVALIYTPANFEKNSRAQFFRDMHAARGERFACSARIGQSPGCMSCDLLGGCG